VLLSKTEKAYLSGAREFTKAQRRCIKSRLNKKLRCLEEELRQLGNVAEYSSGGVAEFCNALIKKEADPQGFEPWISASQGVNPEVAAVPKTAAMS
jgi:hypothetical protein